MNLLPLLFVGLGVVLLLAAWAVWHQGRRIRECVRDLMALPDEGHPMDWPLQASKVLRRAGIGGMAWQGQWFGDPVQGQWGNPANPDWTGLTLEAGPDCSIELSWAGLARTNEARALALVFRLAREVRDAWVNWPARAAALMAADLGVEPAAMQKVLEKHVRAHLDELAEVRPDFR